jgi:hypothetical protein
VFYALSVGSTAPTNNAGNAEATTGQLLTGDKQKANTQAVRHYSSNFVCLMVIMLCFLSCTADWCILRQSGKGPLARREVLKLEVPT